MKHMKKKQISFKTDAELIRLITVLRKFFGVSTNNKILPQIVLLAIADVAILPEDESWTPQQKASWRECKLAANEFQQSLMLVAAERVLEKKKPNDKMSLEELSGETIAELLPRKTLVEFAEQLNTNCAGLHRSKIVQRIRDASV